MQQLLTIVQTVGTLAVFAAAAMDVTIVRKARGMVRPDRRAPGAAQRFLCLSVDVQGYGCNDDVRQAEITRDLVRLLDRAGQRAGVDRRRWFREIRGDEELALVPASEPYGLVVGEFCLELAAALWRHNAGRDRSRRMRLRLAIDDGPVDVSPNGFVGRAVVGACRLVNAQPLRLALELTEQAELAVILSDGVYRDWVHSGRSAVQTGWCRRIAIAEKECRTEAWLWLPRADVHHLPLTGCPSDVW